MSGNESKGSNENDSSSSSDESCSASGKSLSNDESLHSNESLRIGTLVLDESPDTTHKTLEITTEERIKRGNKEYELVRTYPSLVDASEGVKNKEICDQFWTRGVSYTTAQGDKICYTCRGFPKCPKRMQLHLDTESQDVHVHVSSDGHDHLARNHQTRLNPLSKAKVLELLEIGVTL